MTRFAVSSSSSSFTSSISTAVDAAPAAAVKRARPGLRLAVVMAAAIAATALSACAPLIVAGAAVGGTMVAVDRRTPGAQLDDQTIELKASTRVSEVVGSLAHVSATSYNRVLLVTGEVPNENDKASIVRVLSSIENVKSIVNEVVVAPSSSITTRSQDTIVTGKVKATFIDAKDLVGNAFKVVTENGTVYLMGRVTEREAKRATDLTSRISGVKRVVRVFDIVSEAELAQIQSKPADPSNTGTPAAPRP